VHLVRIHLEEDVAKSFHFETSTGIDFNRAGTPLMEIVTQPEINSPERLSRFSRRSNRSWFTARSADADMEKGATALRLQRFRASGETDGARAKIEIKNMNSISVCAARWRLIIQRQTEALERGEKLQQETRGWDDAAGETFLMRTKESAHDYRYFPDPDLVPVKK